LGLYVALPLALLYAFVLLFEDFFIYFPARYPEGYWDVKATPFPLEDVTFLTADGVKIHGWYARGKGATWTLLVFHGNAGNVTHRWDLILRLTRLPADVLIFDYRGYGKSEGTPSEAGLYADARAAYEFLTRERGVAPERLVLYGKSLGAAPAIELATQAPCARLVIQSAFTGIPDMAAASFPLLPFRWMVRHRYDNLSKVPLLKMPKLHIHSRDDEIVPFEQGRRLFEAAAEPKEFYEVAGAGHNELIPMESERWEERLRRFLELPPPPGP
jgi:fermentation-respiration switch protein FrsA (DUF1100 family)